MPDGNRPRPSRCSWPRDFPEIVVHCAVRRRDAHPCYITAKSGDPGAALELVSDIFDPDKIDEIRRSLNKLHPLLVPVRAIENSGRNYIPDAYAERLAHDLGLTVDTRIVQVNVVGHTRASGFARIARPAAFVGEVDTGRQYVVIDDHVGLGGTIANIRGHIERHGGVVLLATTLTASAGSQHIALKPAMLGKLRDKHGKALEAWWRKTFGHGLECLTNPEAGYLFRTPDVERIRDRLAAEERRSFP